MRRRNFIAFLSGAAAAWPLKARARIAYAKANPGKLNFSAPYGGKVQLSGELFPGNQTG